MARGDPPKSLEELGPYYAGTFYTTVALKSRLAKCCPGPEGRQALQEVSRYQRMVTEFREAIQQTLELKRNR